MNVIVFVLIGSIVLFLIFALLLEKKKKKQYEEASVDGYKKEDKFKFLNSIGKKIPWSISLKILIAIVFVYGLIRLCIFNTKEYVDGNISFKYPYTFKIEKDTIMSDVHFLMLMDEDEKGAISIYYGKVKDSNKVEQKNAISLINLSQAGRLALITFPNVTLEEPIAVNETGPIVKHTMDFYCKNCVGRCISEIGNSYELTIIVYAEDEEKFNEIIEYAENIKIQ